ncbi:hypothetical protein JOF41_000154 [Saccharothrix coeruleofusca]|nr:DUF4162 domain-containing protein [Saccharothrix coeruleofusca]MBP2333976.1 hypothetical protein [Saccharothrix coeruleofusca]
MSARHRWVEADEAEVDVRHLPGVVEVARRDGVLRVRTDGDASARAVLDFLLDNGVRSVRAAPPTLEEVYLEIIGSRGMGV